MHPTQLCELKSSSSSKTPNFQVSDIKSELYLYPTVKPTKDAFATVVETYMFVLWHYIVEYIIVY